MNATLRQLLHEIREELTSFDEQMEAPASTAQLAALQVDSASQLAYALPAEHLELLAAHDGIDCNGIQLYASEARTENNGSDRPDYLKRGFVEANLIWREFEPNKDYIFFAESGSDLYQHNLQTNQFEVADRVGRTVFDRFATAEALFETLFNHMLDRYGVAEDE